MSNQQDIQSVEPYVDERVLQERTGLARVTWQKHRSKGTGPRFFKAGRRCLYRWSDVVSWIEGRAVGAAEVTR